ncbi:HNH endonuclease [Granulicella tundricola]|uniref:HNH endonuclease n=1 Tax=Granulicella tundricola (strain ATCC BAA-1859 / DSM 23138 / MP5ACTX9) TaxID=1198114 RepID=E8X2E2_GRATM|nr:HNH endonuclease domain-containing protein [Granulicella tundricola]ADW68074.1 HNH endonuclease [Granulicella tundricola MP5ACTX9]
MPPPTPAQQIKFLTNLQRLLAEGSFTATYKYALLAALADLSVEHGDDSGEPLVFSLFAIAEKLVEYYWRHATPYAGGQETRVLQQSTGSQARIIRLVSEARQSHGVSLASMMRLPGAWNALVRSVVPTLREQPLWRLQVVGLETLDFLYGRSGTKDIELRHGIAYCFRQFFTLVQDLVRAAWLRDVRRLNGEFIGEPTDLRDFLFGAERSALTAAKPVLMELQDGRCFYCAGALIEVRAEVDHFIPWSRYPADLVHNLVLADRRCNSKKRDRIAHADHLDRWTDRNRRDGDGLASAMAGRVVCDLKSANSVAYWSYAQTEDAKGLTWMHGDILGPLSPAWRNAFPDSANEGIVGNASS